MNQKLIFLLISIPIAITAFFTFRVDHKYQTNEENIDTTSASINVSKHTSESSTNINKIVEKSLSSIAAGEKFNANLNDNELLHLREEIKKTDPNYLEKQILKRSPKLKEFRSEFFRIIKSRDQSIKYQEILTNEKLITESIKSLSSEEYTDLDPENQIERMIYVDYTNERISQSQKKGDGSIHDDIFSIITSSTHLDKSKSLDLRKSLYVDRIEVFKRYYKSYPNHALYILSQLPETKYKQYLVSTI